MSTLHPQPSNGPGPSYGPEASPLSLRDRMIADLSSGGGPLITPLQSARIAGLFDELEALRLRAEGARMQPDELFYAIRNERSGLGDEISIGWTPEGVDLEHFSITRWADVLVGRTEREMRQVDRLNLEALADAEGRIHPVLRERYFEDAERRSYAMTDQDGRRFRCAPLGASYSETISIVRESAGGHRAFRFALVSGFAYTGDLDGASEVVKLERRCASRAINAAHAEVIAERAALLLEEGAKILESSL